MYDPNHLKRSPKASGQIWSTWFILLILSVGMALTGYLHLPRQTTLVLLPVIMVVMAWLILSRYMHLGEENSLLISSAIGGTLFISIFLLGFLVWDAVCIYQASPH